MKIIQIVGARPQFVKLAPLSRAIRSKGHKEIIIHSGQHYDAQMNDVFFQEMEIPAPDYYLGVGSGTGGVQTAEILAKVEPILMSEKPDQVIVYGDTNTTLAGALATVKLNIKLIHVEACLRSFNRTMPEEINRIVTDHVSDILLVPTVKALENAENEGLRQKCHLVGDIMVDSLMFGIDKAKKISQALSKLNLFPNQYFLLTLHRPYNVDDPDNLGTILRKLDSLGEIIVFPVHPRTKNMLDKISEHNFSNIKFVPPQAYLDFLMLLDNCKMILSDSGGIQKEAYILKKPCVTLRYETEWVETVESGWNLLLPPSSSNFPGSILDFNCPLEHPNIFGNDVAERILNVLQMYA